MTTLAPAGVVYRRIWLPTYPSAWSIWRQRQFIGTAVRLSRPRRWLAALPDGTFALDEDGCATWYRTRQGATLRLLMAADGVEP